MYHPGMVEQPVRAVVFDLGNTLWFDAAERDPREIYAIGAERLAPLLAEWGVALDEPVEDILRDVWEAIEESYRRELARGTCRDPYLPAFVRAALQMRGVEIGDAQAEAWWRMAYVPVREFGFQLYPDALDVLAELKDQGMLIAINSNRPFTAGMIAGDLADYGLAPYVDAVVCSGDVGFFKPHPAPFEQALRLLGVPPADALMVGDGVEVDIAGAKAVGMRTAWKQNGRYGLPACPDADFAVHELAELLALPVLPRRRDPAVAESATPHEDANLDRY